MAAPAPDAKALPYWPLAHRAAKLSENAPQPCWSKVAPLANIWP